jgi:hypothetical protein
MPYDATELSSQLKQLTLEEKVALLAGEGFATTAGIKRLGIPHLKVRPKQACNSNQVFLYLKTSG